MVLVVARDLRNKLTFHADKFTAYFPKGYTEEQMEESILRILAERQRMLKRDRDDDH